MKKKLTVFSLSLLLGAGIAISKLMPVTAEGVVKEDKTVLSDENFLSGDAESLESWPTDVESWPKDETATAALPEIPPLSQEEYDDLIKSLPEGAVIVGEVEVLPGVIKDPTKEKDDAYLYAED